METIDLIFGICIQIHAPGIGTISSCLRDGCDPEEDQQYLAAVNALESLVLAQALAGIDVTSTAYRDALETSVESIANYYG